MNEGQLAAIIAWGVMVLGAILFAVWDAWNLKKKGLI